MPPLIVFIVGILSVILFMTVPVWLAVVIVTVLVFTCLFRIRHLRQTHEQRNQSQGDSSVLPIVGDDSINSRATSGGHSHHHPDAASFGGGDAGGHHGGGGSHH